MFNNKTIVLTIAIILSLFLLQNPILNAVSNITSIFRKDNLTELEIKSYKQKIEYLEKELLDYQEFHKNLPIYSKSSLILSRIALRNIYDFYDSIIISTDTKVSKSSAVIDDRGLVGFITETNGNTSKVELLTTNKNLSVKVCNSYGLLNRYIRKEKMLVLSNINNYDDIKTGCIVETSGLQENFKGLKIGEVIKTETKGIERIVYVKPYVDFDNLNYLYVIEQ